MDEYQHPLFFEARNLTDTEKKKIRRHFQKRRDSGGGDCAKIEKVGDNIYKVSFKEQQDQERVLQKKTHIISLPDGELQLTVSQTTSSQTLNQPSTSQSQRPDKPNTKCLEKIFKLDVFLLNYLRDNPKALKILKKQLSAIDCTIEFNLDEEEAVVVEKGAVGAFSSVTEDWELKVDQIFISLNENYCCYHVFEAKQIKKVLHDPSFTADNIKVYTESGYAVVVGETEAVNEKIAFLEKSFLTKKELPVVDKNFKLVEDEFKREMSSNYPEVQVSRGPNSIILEGPDEKVQMGAAKLDEMMKKIKEKRLKLNPELLHFMSISGFGFKYQTRFQQSLRSPVSVEVGSDLVLSSLSPDSLDEAERAVLRDLSVTSIELQGAAAVPPDLTRVKEMLIKTKDEANRGEFRVDVSFISSSGGTPTTTVQLVGYTEHVNKLKDVINDYQLNQVSTQEVLNLQLPEMVDHFDKILKMIGITQTKVTLKASHFPNPCVLLSGPLRLVKETQQALVSALTILTLDTLVLDGPGAHLYFQGDGKVSKVSIEGSCQVLIWEHQNVYSTPGKTKPRSISCPSSLTPRPPITRRRFNTVGRVSEVNLEIKICSLEENQVNVLMAPMLNCQLSSTNIGNYLLQYGGNTLQSNFNSKAAHRTLVPGEVLEVDASSSLGCSKIFFIECTPWDGVTGKSVQALCNGLRRCLDLCVQQGFSSVAIPVIGLGAVLKYPLSEAVQVLKESICQFGLSANCGSLTTIQIVIKPGCPDSVECFHDIHKHLSLHMSRGGQAVFRSLTTDLDDIDMSVGGSAKLQVVFGDITNETTDVVVNTTDFTNFHDDVCKDILTLGGPQVAAELKSAKRTQGEIFVSKPGLFPCKAIIHVCGEKNADVIKTLVFKMVKYCEDSGYTSVAIPAICAGAGGMDPAVVADAILQGIKAATSITSLHKLTTIRLVLNKMNVFLAFKKEATQIFSTLVRKVLVPQLPLVQQPSVSADLSILHTSTACRSTFQFIGLHKKNVDDAKQKLKNLFEAQCSTQTVRKEDLEDLTNDNVLSLQQLVETEGLYVQTDPSGNLTVCGIKDGINKMIICMHDFLKEKVRSNEEDSLYSRVMWCILGPNGDWERLPETANYVLENKDTAGGILDAHGVLWQVQNMEATSQLQKTKLKRLEILQDFTPPLYWDSMAASETMKIVELKSSSREYQRVKDAFKRTSTKTVIKVERLQNIHLHRAYEAKRKHLSEKNKLRGGEREKFLYHGTAQDNSVSIMKTGFNRSFAGQNATAYGHGSYFAVSASYSANPTYSKPAADGSQLMFVARVLTGSYTQGQSGMKAPPYLNNQQPHDRYDSVVDKVDNPSMYVVFHDDQAYPDYLITFK